MNLNRCILIGQIILLLACSNSDDGSSVESNSIKTSAIEGDWVTPCLLLSGTFFYSQYRYSFRDGNYNAYLMLFEDSGCSLLISETEETYQRATYVLGDVLTTDSGIEATEIDLVYQDSSASYSIFAVIDNVLYFGIWPNAPEQRPTELIFTWGGYTRYEE